MEAIIVAIGSGMFSALFTVAALKTDINWLKREVSRLDGGMIRAHSRIDELKNEAR